MKQLEPFLEKVTYYHNFVPNFTTTAALLNRLCTKNIKFKCDADRKKHLKTSNYM